MADFIPEDQRQAGEAEQQQKRCADQARPSVDEIVPFEHMDGHGTVD
jgi:hypothetical protein